MNQMNISVWGIGAHGIEATCYTYHHNINFDEAKISFYGIHCNSDLKKFSSGKNIIKDMTEVDSAFIKNQSTISDISIICLDYNEANCLICAKKIAKILKGNGVIVCIIISGNEETFNSLNVLNQEITSFSDTIIFAKSKGDDSVLQDALSMIIGQLDTNSVIICSPDDMKDFLKDNEKGDFVSIVSKGECLFEKIISKLRSEILTEISPRKSKKIMLRLEFSEDVQYSKIDELIGRITDIFSEDADIILGMTINHRAYSSLKLSIIAVS